MTGPTPYAELNGLVAEIATHAEDVFGTDLVGVYLVGSFAVGDADEHSDCDFLVVVEEEPSGEREHAVRALHADIPTRAGRWCHDLEGSYAVRGDLADLETIGREWLFVDHGHTEMEWSAHCNLEVVRWSLLEHGVTVRGPEPRSFVAPVPPDLMREAMRRALPTLRDDILGWAPLEWAWSQRYLVSNHCRVLYTLVTAEVTSKRGALEWAMDALDDRWRPLLTQAREDRARGWDPADPPPAGSLQETFAFCAYACEWATGLTA